MDADPGTADYPIEGCMMEGFCESCGNNAEMWFNGEYCRVRCLSQGVINRSDIRLRCGEWQDKKSMQQGLFLSEDKQ